MDDDVSLVLAAAKGFSADSGHGPRLMSVKILVQPECEVKGILETQIMNVVLAVSTGFRSYGTCP